MLFNENVKHKNHKITVDSNETIDSSHLWHQMAGGQISGSEESCLGPDQVVFSKKNFHMCQDGTRSLVTFDIDTSQSSLV